MCTQIVKKRIEYSLAKHRVSTLWNWLFGKLQEFRLHLFYHIILKKWNCCHFSHWYFTVLYCLRYYPLPLYSASAASMVSLFSRTFLDQEALFSPIPVQEIKVMTYEDGSLFDGTHPTGMHSCLFISSSCLSTGFYDQWRLKDNTAPLFNVHKYFVFVTWITTYHVGN